MIGMDPLVSEGLRHRATQSKPDCTAEPAARSANSTTTTSPPAATATQQDQAPLGKTPDGTGMSLHSLLLLQGYKATAA